MTKIKSAVLMMLLACLVTVPTSATAKTAIRVTELNPKVWSDLEKGIAQELLIEFRQGDRLPITLGAQGDLIETTESHPSYVTVRRSFWIKLTQADVQMSLDGSTFRPINQIVGGTFNIGASADHTDGRTASAINMLFKAYIK